MPMVKRAIQKYAPKELKFEDQEIDLFTTNITQYTTSLHKIAQGSEVNMRDGSKIFLKRLLVRLEVGFDPVGLAVEGRIANIHCWIVKGREEIGVKPVLADLLADPTDYENSFLALANSPTKFRVMRHLAMKFDPTVDRDSQFRSLTINFKKNHMVKFFDGSSGGDEVDTASGGIYAIFAIPGMMWRAEQIL